MEHLTSSAHRNTQNWIRAYGRSERRTINYDGTQLHQAYGRTNVRASTARGRRALHPSLDHAYRQEHLMPFSIRRVSDLPGRLPMPVSSDAAGIPSLNAPASQEDQRASNVSLNHADATAIKSSERDKQDMENMDLEQKFRRSFAKRWAKIPPFGLLGVGSMHLAIWEQTLLILGLVLPNGGIGTALVVWLIVATVYGPINKSLADMAGEYPTYAGPFYWTAAYQTASTISRMRRLLCWLCAWMTFLGMSINLSINMVFVSDVATFIFALANKQANFLFSSNEPVNYLRVPWALPVTIGVALTIATTLSWVNARHLPALHTLFAISHWIGFVLFVVAIPVLCHKAAGLNMTVQETWRHFVSTSGWHEVVSGFVAASVLVQPFHSSGFVAYVAEEVVDAAWLIPLTMHISYFLEVAMGFAMLMVVAISVGDSKMATPHELAIMVLQTRYVSMAYFLAAVLLILFIMRSTTLLASTARQIMAIARSCDSKGLSFLNEIDGSPAPRIAVLLVSILTAGLGALTLLSEYRTLFEHMRRFGVLCTLSSHLICIGSLCIYRLQTCPETHTENCLQRFSTIFNHINHCLAFLFCVLFFVSVSFPPGLPVRWRNAPWSLAAWLCTIVWLLIWYWRSGRANFVVGKLPQRTPTLPTAISATGVNPTSSAATGLARQVSIQSRTTDSWTSSEEEPGRYRDEIPRIPTPEWLKRGSIARDGHRSLDRIDECGHMMQCDSDESSSNHQAASNFSRAQTYSCLDPSRCPQSASIADLGPSSTAERLCQNCRS